jgi:hypothetical protein
LIGSVEFLKAINKPEKHMKSLLLLSLFLVISSAQVSAAPSDEFMSIEEQGKKIEDLARGIRRNYWVSGHEDVSSHEFFMTKEAIDEHIEGNSYYEDALDTDEIEDLYKCHYSKSCELYQVSVSGSYWGGYGTSSHFILLYTKSGKSYEIEHITYAE